MMKSSKKPIEEPRTVEQKILSSIMSIEETNDVSQWDQAISGIIRFSNAHKCRYKNLISSIIYKCLFDGGLVYNECVFKKIVTQHNPEKIAYVLDNLTALLTEHESSFERGLRSIEHKTHQNGLLFVFTRHREERITEKYLDSIRIMLDKAVCNNPKISFREQKQLIQHKPRNGFTSLIIAIEIGHFDIYHSIMQYYDFTNPHDLVSFVTPNKSGFHALMQAIMNVNTDILIDLVQRINDHKTYFLETVIDQSSIFETMIFQVNQDGFNIFHQACSQMHPVEKLSLLYNMICHCLPQKKFEAIDRLRRQINRFGFKPSSKPSHSDEERFLIDRQLSLFTYCQKDGAATLTEPLRNDLFTLR